MSKKVANANSALNGQSAVVVKKQAVVVDDSEADILERPNAAKTLLLLQFLEPCLRRNVKNRKDLEKKDRMWSLPVAFSFCINYIIGVGILAVPYAFTQAGPVLASILLALASVLAWVSALFLMEILARTESLFQSGYFRNSSTLHENLLESANESVSRNSSLANDDHAISDARKFETNSVVGLYFGRRWEIAYTICIVLFIFSGLWAYATVFANSMMVFVPFPGLSAGLKPSSTNSTLATICIDYISLDTQNTPSMCQNAYNVYLAIFGTIVTLLTMLNLTEQKYIQLFMTLYRFLAIIIMLGCVIVGLFTAPFDAHAPVKSAPHTADIPSLANLAKFALIFSTSVFAQILHHSVPGLMEPVREKSRGRFLFASVIITTMTVYWLVGMMGSIYFGTSVSSPVTLMWLDYPFNGIGAPSATTSLLVLLVVLFPILDVVSAFPLNAVTMANSIFDFLPHPIRKHPRHGKLIRVATRLVAALPPLAAAYGMRSLSRIVDFAGILGFIIMFVAPAALYYKSSVACEAWWGSSGAVTVYFTRGVSTKGASLAMLVFGIVAFLAVFVYEAVNYNK